MIYPDSSLLHQICPICKSKLYIKPTQIAKIYECTRNKFGRIPHYEFIRYKDGSVATNYIIENWWIMSDEEYSIINLVSNNCVYSSEYTELGYRKNSMLLGCDNLGKIKKN